MIWKVEGKDITIRLIKPEELETLVAGTVLYSIFGKRYVIGQDRIDGDTRCGFLAYGFRLNHKGAN